MGTHLALLVRIFEKLTDQQIETFAQFDDDIENLYDWEQNDLSKYMLGHSFYCLRYLRELEEGEGGRDGK